MRFKMSWLRLSAGDWVFVVIGALLVFWLSSREQSEQAPESRAVRGGVEGARDEFLPPPPPPPEQPGRVQRPENREMPGGSARRGSRAGGGVDTPVPTDPAELEKLGRAVLGLVGADPQADMIWAWLINDPKLPTEVRSGLIKDLNASGFSGGDGRPPGVDDLPLIERRMQLMEEHAEFALDAANAAAFATAYQDLAGLWWRLSQ